MHSVDMLLLYHLEGEYKMTDQEKLMSQVRQETYQLYKDEKESHRYFRQKVRDLI